MKKRIKTAGALTLAAITVLSAAGLSSVYGALGVETDEKCSLNLHWTTRSSMSFVAWRFRWMCTR